MVNNAFKTKTSGGQNLIIEEPCILPEDNSTGLNSLAPPKPFLYNLQQTDCFRCFKFHIHLALAKFQS